MRFYHIYPLGFCGAPHERSSEDTTIPRLHQVTAHLDYVRALGFDALYLGPLFESISHGYDTSDYFHVDRRLGTNEDLSALVKRAHELGIKVVLDGVFNHVGRDFWAFIDLKEEREASEYRSWFRNVSFDTDNRFGDGLVYDGWEGVEELVELNHDEAAVREHLCAAAEAWIDEFDVDGIRLDVAYALPFPFLDELSRRVHAKREDFFLLGEVIHGDYASFLEPGRLDSITNYECYKGIWSSCNDSNLFEIAHSLERLFGAGGLLEDAVHRGQLPYNFSDNHDVDRLATSLRDKRHLFAALALLWSLPGHPSLYYGSEYGLEGAKDHGDSVLRPAWSDVEQKIEASDAAVVPGDVREFVAKLNEIREAHPVLVDGSYRKLALENQSLAFERRGAEGETIVVALNIAADPATIRVPEAAHGRYRSLYSGEEVALDAKTGIELPAFGSEWLTSL
jgi:cyclomaltodextrinase / maltogenic alpha-amylase / neopullulanase